MSHFSTIVKINANVVEDELVPAIENRMAPYQENNMGDVSKVYMEFMDEGEEAKENYENGSSMMLTDGEELWLPWDAPDDDSLEEKEVPNKERHDSFEEFIDFWYGYTEKDPGTGKYGYWYNPEARWDYWSVGGRFSNLIILKDGVTEFGYGNHRFPKEVESVDGRADYTRLKNIDLEAYKETAEEKADSCYDRLILMKGTKHIEGNSDRLEAMLTMVEDRDLQVELNEDGSIPTFLPCSTARFLERKGLTEVDASASDKAIEDMSIEEMKECPVKYSDISREEFIHEYKYEWYLNTPAVCDEAGWHEVGEMGWFGTSTSTPDSEESWSKSFESIFLSEKNNDPDEWVAVVDCHI